MSDSSSPSNVSASASPPSRSRPWYQRIGPALITACVVIGPGSILTSSKVGAQYGFSMSWVVVVSVVFMLAYMSIGARLGVVASESPADLVARLAGRWLAVLIGGCVFFISSAFQFGNNLGVDSAVRLYADTEWVGAMRTSLGFDPLDLTVVFFNAMTILFLFAFRNLYRAVERLMMTFVGIMLVSFAINLAFARPSPSQMVAGLIPTNPATVGLPLLGLVGTTFVISAAYFQAYLVR
ncbi:MAG: divalent metal cation transporter, partial [Pirellulales bacterium]